MRKPVQLYATLWRIPLGLVLGLLLFAIPTKTWAQSDNTAFQLQQFRPWGDPEGLFHSQSGEGLGQWNFKVGLFLNYTKDPLLLRVFRSDRPNTSERIDILQHQFAGDLIAGIGFFNWLDLELVVPVTFYQAGKIPNNDVIANDLRQRDVSGAFFSDIKIGLKFQALREKSHWLNMAIKLYLGVPSGYRDSFNGEDGVSFGVSLLFNKHISIVNLALNLGYRYLPRSQFANLVVSHELTYGLGLGVEVVKNRLDLMGELVGATQLAEGVSENGAPFEVLLGGRIYPLNQSKDLAIHIGVGLPLLPGYGTPQFRIFAGLVYARRVFDRDKDGVPDDKDRCPDEKGPAENQGCPWPDTDGDGLTDNVDKCPTVPGPKENHGCPWGDQDKDGVKDNVDDCPTVPGPVENKGCPWPDRDKDGVHDKIDACPDQPGPAKYNGCPDTDGDGLHDKIDMCPTRAGPKENQGCPDTDGDGYHDGIDQCPNEWGPPKPPIPPPGYKLGCPLAKMDIQGGKLRKIAILDKIYFEFNRWRILPRSFPLLDNVVKILQEYPQIRIRIEGHTDRIGSHNYNMWLSRKRAASVRQYLISKGIAKKRLLSRGYGFTKPIDTNKTQEGRDRNRRVEFVVLGNVDAPIKRMDRDTPRY